MHVFLHLLFFLSSHFFSWKSPVATKQIILFLYSFWTISHTWQSFSIGNIACSMKMQFFSKNINYTFLFTFVPSCSFSHLKCKTEKQKDFVFHKIKLTLFGSTILRTSSLALYFSQTTSVLAYKKGEFQPFSPPLSTSFVVRYYLIQLCS